MMNLSTYFMDLKALQDNITRWVTTEWHIQPWFQWKKLQYPSSDNIPGRPNHGPRRSENVLRRSNNVPGRSSNAPERVDNVHRRSKNVPRRWHLFPWGQTWMYGPKNCWKMSFSIVVSAHITPKTNQYFPEIFRHQPLPKYFIFTYIKCTCYAQSKTIFSELFQHKPLP